MRHKLPGQIRPRNSITVPIESYEAILAVDSEGHVKVRSKQVKIQNL